MKYAIFDTETSGLPLYKDAAGVPIPADDPRQPRLAHLAMILVDEQLREERAIDLYVRPDGWSMPQGPGTAGAVNGLTDEFLTENGADILDVLDQYVRVIDAGYVLVAYHAQFDLKVMRGELRRADIDDRFELTPNICAMRASMKLGVQKPGARGGYPKLEHVCAHLGIKLEGAHTAGGDTRACLEVFRYLHANGLLPEARVHYAKTPPLAPTEAPVPLPVAVPESF